MSAVAPEIEMGWRKYNLYVSLYQYYLTLLVQYNTLQMAVTGGLLAYILSHPHESRLVWALLLPCLFALGQASVIIFSFKPFGHLRDAVREVGKEIRFVGTVTLTPLKIMMVVFLIINFVMAAGLLVIVLNPELIVSPSK